jgi:XTP/dITP diphosphohydrolase
VTEAEEPHPSFVENAIAKARHAARATGLPALADDSGLCVGPRRRAGRAVGTLAGEPKSDAATTPCCSKSSPASRPPRALLLRLVLVRHADDPQP